MYFKSGSSIQGDMYWRFDDEEQVVELDYPRDINMWKGVPRDIDAVFQYTDKKTYFFKVEIDRCLHSTRYHCKD